MPRLKILEIFQRAKQRHMTAEDVYRLLIIHRCASRPVEAMD